MLHLRAQHAKGEGRQLRLHWFTAVKAAAAAGLALVFASGVHAASLTFGLGGAASQSQGQTVSQSGSASGAAILGIAAGSSSGQSTTGHAAGAFAQTTPGGMVSGAGQIGASSSQTNTASGALGLAATLNGSQAGGTSIGNAFGGGAFGTIVLSPLP